MRVKDHHGKRTLQLLLDTGNTHNFTKALKLDYKVDTIDPMWGKVADGEQLQCNSMIKGFT